MSNMSCLSFVSRPLLSVLSSAVVPSAGNTLNRQPCLTEFVNIESKYRGSYPNNNVHWVKAQNKML